MKSLMPRPSDRHTHGAADQRALRRGAGRYWHSVGRPTVMRAKALRNGALLATLAVITMWVGMRVGRQPVIEHGQLFGKVAVRRDGRPCCARHGQPARDV